MLQKSSHKFGTISNLLRRKQKWNNNIKNGNCTPYTTALFSENNEHFSKHQIHRKKEENSAMHINQWH